MLQNGTKIWNTTRDNEGQAGKIWEPGTLFRLDQDADIQLWEYDPDSPDDLLGQTSIVPAEAGQGEKTRDFTGDEGHYKFTYKVVRV